MVAMAAAAVAGEELGTRVAEAKREEAMEEGGVGATTREEATGEGIAWATRSPTRPTPAPPPVRQPMAGEG